MKNKINYWWRILATGICFSCFGIGALILTIFVFPLQKLFFRKKLKRKKIARKTVHLTFKWFIAFMQFSGVFKFELDEVQSLKILNYAMIPMYSRHCPP